MKEVNYSTIRTHFESFVESQFLKSLMEIDVHFMTQHNILCDFASSSRLRIYRLSEIERLENDINHFLFTNFFKGRLDIPRSNTSLISVDHLGISLKCRTLVESLYEEDVRMIEMQTNSIEQITKSQHTQKEESLMSIAVNEIRERNRRIMAIYLKHKGQLTFYLIEALI